YITVGSDTFIHDMLRYCGLNNVFAEDTRYPAISIEKIKAKNPQLILLSSEPYPFKEQHMQELNAQIPEAKCILVDGEIFSWYGSRLKL
ncbi:helical backbone metal receptor, partial [Acinetobacter baumannii]